MSSRTKRSRKRRPAARRAGTATGVAQVSAGAHGEIVSDGELVSMTGEQAAADEAAAEAPRGGAPGARRRSRSRERRERADAVYARPQTPVSVRYGERPRPPWHPLPLSELLILVGAIGVVVGFRKGLSHGGPPLFAGIAAVALGTLEVTLREHRSGFRSHTVMLAALPVVVFHSTIALVIAAFARMPAVATIGLFALDLMLFLVLFKLLRNSFLTARTRAAGRR